MIDRDRQSFASTLAAVYTFYDKDLSDSAFEIWWTSMKHFDLPAVVDALGRHAMNPDGGRFIPKPADVVLMLGGSTLDAALVALQKFEEAMSRLGSGYSVAFDDPLIHVVAEELGGWHACCMTKTKDWEFRRNEFLNRYRSYKRRGDRPAHRPVLTGTFDAENERNGFADDPRVKGIHLRLVGDPAAAREVMKLGAPEGRLRITNVAAVATQAARAIEDKRETKKPHKDGCPALGGYGTADRACICGAIL